MQGDPTRPTLIWDGDCAFCAGWVARWRHATGPHVDYVRAQDVGERFPEVPRERLRDSVALVEPGGRATFGAEAVAGALAAGGKPGFLRAYRALRPVRAGSDATYALVAHRRRAFSRATRLLWGAPGPVTTFRVSTWLFTRLLGIVLLVAFISLAVQVHGLVGEAGILPVGEHLALLETRVGEDAARRIAPTLLWVDATDRGLSLTCALGFVASALLVLGVAPLASVLVAWACYLSLVVAGQDFLQFQWDALLLEASLLAALLVPWALATPPQRWPDPPRLARWALAFLLFRLMFLSGWVKLASGDPTWRDLSAMDFHYLTQPLPNPVAWLAWRLPEGAHRLEVMVTFAIELVLPFAIVMPRRPRLVAFWGFAGLQVVIVTTGNYGFFNLLTFALVLLLLDDACFPESWRRRFDTGLPPARRWPGWMVAPLVVGAVVLACMSATRRMGWYVAWPRALQHAHRAVAPLHSFNAYGLFAVMTTERRELVVEGSDDLREWKPYVLRWQPGPVDRSPPVAGPHMPRLDWQMWFAALGRWGPGGSDEWVERFLVRLLEGSPDVLALVDGNPFPHAPPRFVRVAQYEYRFSTWDELRGAGVWWTRERLSDWSPVLSLKPRGG